MELERFFGEKAAHMEPMPDQPSALARPPEFLAGDSEVRRLMSVCDWRATPLGPPQSWPMSLRATVRIMLTSRFAMWAAWGPELTFLCNDAYLPTVGIKRDWVIGSRSDKVWAEIWSDIGPRIEHVLKTGEATWDEALLLYLERSGFTEETYHTFSYSPLADDVGRTSGMLCVVAEVTEKVIGERQLAMLRDLGGQLAATSTRDEVMAALVGCLASEPRDIPFALAYLSEPGGAALAAAHGLDHDNPAAKSRIDFDRPATPWDLAKVMSGNPVLVAAPEDAMAALLLQHCRSRRCKRLSPPCAARKAARQSVILWRASIHIER